MRLHSKVAIVTGGALGIGGGISRRFAAEGAAVMIADVNFEAAQANVERITAAGGTAQYTPTDVSDPAQVEKLFEATLSAFGRLDILVNNAAIAHGPKSRQHFLEMPPEMWHQLIGVHLNGLFYCSQQAAKIMVQQNEGGCIINMSSGGATRAHRQMVAYDMTKGGIEAATRAMALDLAPYNIRVNAVVPDMIWVESRGPLDGPLQPNDKIPLGHLGMPEDVAGAALFLASADAAYVTGHCLVVDGGLTTQLCPPPGADAKR